MQTTRKKLYDHAHGGSKLMQTEETVSPSPHSSVEIAMDSKGNARPTVKVYHENANEAASKAIELYRHVLKEFGESA